MENVESRLRTILAEYGLEVEPGSLATALAVRVVDAEREVERMAEALSGATEDAAASAKAGDLRRSVRGDLLAAVTDKAAALDAALMKVAERREALAMTAEFAKRAS